MGYAPLGRKKTRRIEREAAMEPDSIVHCYTRVNGHGYRDDPAEWIFVTRDHQHGVYEPATGTLKITRACPITPFCLSHFDGDAYAPKVWVSPVDATPTRPAGWNPPIEVSELEQQLRSDPV